MALTAEQLETLGKAAELVLAARLTLEDAIVIQVVDRIFDVSLTGKLIDICADIIDFEAAAAEEING